MNEKKKPILGQEAVTDARTLGTPRMLILGLQHLFAMFGATVLVPILVQGYGLPLSIQTTLLMAGLGTLLFHVCTKFKVPAFLGSSFAYLGGFSTVASMPAYDGLAPELKLAYALGGIVIAGLLYLVLALLFKVLGAKTVMRYFPPIVTGPMIIMIGLNLSGSAIKNAATCWWLALVAMAIIVVANIWGKGMVKIIPILLGVVGSYIVAVIATLCGAQLPDANGVMQPLVNFASVGEAHLIGLQKFILAKFDVSAVLVMAPIAIAAMMEHIGELYPLRHRGRRQLHPLRHDLRRGRPQHRGESGGSDQVPEPDHRRRHVCQRPRLQLRGRRDLHRGRCGCDPVRSGHRCSVRRDPQRHSARQ